MSADDSRSPSIDAHQHFWSYDRSCYDWISEDMKALQRDFLPGDLKPLLEAAGMDGCVAVQALQTVEETRWLLELARQNEFIRGVVGWVELCSPDVEAQLAAIAADPKLVGVRHVVQAEPDDRFMDRADFRRGIEVLARFDLAYDILIFPRQLPAAIDLVKAFPRQRFVLDHIAKPPIAEGLLEPWRTQMRALATHENVLCKVSGMVTEARWRGWHAEDFRPYLEAVLEAFGAGRLMVGSDWPVCTLAADYEGTLQIVRNFLGELSTAEQESILGGNCVRFYQLGN